MRHIFLAALLLAGPAQAQIGTPPSQQSTGNAFAGSCSLDGAALILPSANWGCSRWGANPGEYKVTLPAGYDARNYAIVVSISGNWRGMIQAYAPEATYFLVSVYNTAGAAMDASFAFVVTKNAQIYP